MRKQYTIRAAKIEDRLAVNRAHVRSIREICYKDYGYVEATKKSLIAAQQGKRETALAFNEYAKNSWMKCMREQVDKFYK